MKYYVEDGENGWLMCWEFLSWRSSRKVGGSVYRLGVVFPGCGCSEGLVVVLNTAPPVTDGEQVHDRLVIVLLGVGFETTSCLFISAWAFTPPIAPPTIAPITVNTTRPNMAFPLFVCQKGWRLEVTAKFPGFLASMPLKELLKAASSVFSDERDGQQIRLESNNL